jgi:hypothetical protein
MKRFYLGLLCLLGACGNDPLSGGSMDSAATRDVDVTVTTGGAFVTGVTQLRFGAMVAGVPPVPYAFRGFEAPSSIPPDVRYTLSLPYHWAGTVNVNVAAYDENGIFTASSNSTMLTADRSIPTLLVVTLPRVGFVDAGTLFDADTSDDLAENVDLSSSIDSSVSRDLSVSDTARPADLTSTDFASVPDLAMVCAQTLSNVGGGDFSIRFRLTTLAAGPAALLFQRAACGRGNFWDVYMSGNGTVGVEVDDGVSYTNINSLVTVNDGKPHDITVARKAFILTAAIDGAVSGMGMSQAALGNLPALGIATGNPCGNHPALMPGTVTNVCLVR